MELPRSLEPWSSWLSLFPPDLAESVSHLLLRLQHLVGPIKRTQMQQLATPIGSGDIVRRGEFDRLLASEWLIADAVPEEFLRRAANHELLFTGPVPDATPDTQHCVVLFDCGPEQLGEPRLLHLVLFILIARRAEDAGIAMHWGSLQNPGELSSLNGQKGIRHLLNQRSLRPVLEADVKAWQTALEENQIKPEDVWCICSTRLSLPTRIKTHFRIAHDMLTQQLKVQLTRSQTSRHVMLPLPAEQLAVRILRNPFQPLSPPPASRVHAASPSLQFAPVFSESGTSVAIRTMEKSTQIVFIPNSVKAENKHKYLRLQKDPVYGELLGMRVNSKSASLIVAHHNKIDFLYFDRIPQSDSQVARPSFTDFNAPPCSAKLLPVAFLTHTSSRVLVIDKEMNLVRWFFGKHEDRIAFKIIRRHITGHKAIENTLVYASLAQDSTRIYTFSGVSGKEQHVCVLPFRARKCIFGAGTIDPKFQRAGLLALQSDATHWFMVDGPAMVAVEIEKKEMVLGVANLCSQTSQVPAPHLIVLSHNKKDLYLKSENGKDEIFHSEAKIIRISWHTEKNYLAWLNENKELLVLKVSDRSILQHIVQGKELHA